MFPFENLNLYSEAKQIHIQVRKLIQKIKPDFSTRDQLIRASFSMVLNLAEGTGRFTNKDHRHFYVMSRSSLFETVAVLDVLKDCELISEEQFLSLYRQAEKLSIAIYALIKRLS